jgi:hypothetical protein
MPQWRGLGDASHLIDQQGCLRARKSAQEQGPLF